MLILRLKLRLNKIIWGIIFAKSYQQFEKYYSKFYINEDVITNASKYVGARWKNMMTELQVRNASEYFVLDFRRFPFHLLNVL